MRFRRSWCLTAGAVGFLVLLLSANNIEFAADRSTTILAGGRERSLLTGNAFLQVDALVLTANEIELYGDDFRYAVARGDIEVDDGERGFFLTADRFFYDRVADIARLEGNALMEDRTNEIVVRGGIIENRNGESLTVVQIGVRILRKDLVARAELVRYLRDTNVLELSGLPVVFFKGDEYRANRIIINMDTDEITLQGEVRGQIQQRQDS